MCTIDTVIMYILVHYIDIRYGYFEGTDVKETTINGKSALMYAAENDNKLLVPVGNNSEQGNSEQGTKHMNQSLCNVEIVKLLIWAEAYINEVNNNGHHALYSHIVSCDIVCEDLALLLCAAGKVRGTHQIS